MVSAARFISMVIGFGFVFFSFANAQSYKISGLVTDAITNEPLPGASVMIDNTSQGTVTDLNGKFQLSNIKSDNVTVNISYISYKTYSEKIQFSSNKRHIEINASLKPSTTDLDEVNVYGKAKGNVKAKLVELNAINVKNVVSYEQIEEFPDVNAAEVLQRLPGITLQRDQGEGRYVQLRGTPPELTNFSVNGEQIPSPEGGQRYVGLDIISADQIEFIEVSKVLTPDMDADAIGGNVNIITRSAGEEPETNLSIAGAYNHLRGSFNNFQGNFSQSQRIGKLGISLNTSYYLNNQEAHNIEFEYDKLPYRGSQQDTTGNYYLSYDEIQFRHYEITRRRIGLNATFDYKFNEYSEIYLRGMYNDYSDYETRRRVINTLEDPASFTFYTYGGVDRDVKERTKSQTLTTINLGGRHDMQFLKIEGELAYAHAREDQPDRLEMRFENPGQAITTKIDISDPEWPQINIPDPNHQALVSDYENYEMDELIFTQSLTNDDNLTSKIDFTIPFNYISSSSYIKFGGKMRMKTKERDNNAQSYGRYYSDEDGVPGWHPSQITGGNLSVVTISDGFSENNLLGRNYEVNHTPGPDEIRSYFEMYPHQFRYHFRDSKFETYGQDYEADENIMAFYGMINAEFDKMDVVGGVRLSRTNVQYTGRNIILDSLLNFDRIDTIRDSKEHRFFLPMLQVKYSFTERFNMRGSYTYNFTRPKFDDVMPYRIQDRDNVEYGNPNLIYPIAENIDVFMEYFGIRGTLARGGFFYKNIDNFIYRYRIKAHEYETNIDNPSKPRIEMPLNGREAFVYGFEFLGETMFSFLPGFLQNVGVHVNYTYTQSEAYINERFAGNDHSKSVVFNASYMDELLYNEDELEKINLPGQAKHSGNLSLFFEGSKLYMRLSANYQSDFLHTLGIEKDFDEFYAASLHVDFNAHYAFNSKIKIFTDVVNLTNAPLKYYLGSPDLIQQKEFYSITARMGLKLDL